MGTRLGTWYASRPMRDQVTAIRQRVSFVALAIALVASSGNAQEPQESAAPTREPEAAPPSEAPVDSVTEGSDARSSAAPAPRAPSGREPSPPSPLDSAGSGSAAQANSARADAPPLPVNESQADASESLHPQEPKFPPVSEVKGVGEHAEGYAQRTVGVRGATVFNDANRPLGEVAFYERGVALLAGPWVSARYLDEMWIGGGGGGATYSLSGNLAVGIRREVGPGHGPFARGELRGDLRRTGGVYHSSLRFPGLQLGWGGNHGRWIFEALGHSGFSSTGRLKTEHRRRDIRGWFTGGAWTLGWDRLQVHGDVSYLFTGSPGFWDARANFCSLWGKKPPKKWYSKTAGPNSVNNGPFAVDYSFGLCSDASFLRAESRTDGSALFDQWAFGFSFVVGQFSRLYPLRKP